MKLAPGVVQAKIPGLAGDTWSCFGCGAKYDNQEAAHACLESHGDHRAVWTLARARWDALGIGAASDDDDEEVEASDE